jgi:hypothetical protein
VIRTVEWYKVLAARQLGREVVDGLRAVVVADGAGERCEVPAGLVDQLYDHARTILRPTASGLVRSDLAITDRQVRPVCPLGTLGPVAVAHDGAGLPSPYDYCWAGSAQSEEVGRVLTRSHSDGHVHFNAMLPFEVNFFLGLRSIDPVRPSAVSPRSLGLDYMAGSDLHNTWFLAALALWAITQPSAEGSELGSVLEGGGVPLPLDEPLDLWAVPVLSDDPRGSRHELVVEDVRRVAAEAVIGSLGPPEELSAAGLYAHICRLKETGARLAIRGGWRAAVWMAFVAREHALFRACSVHGSGLEMFSAAFSANRRIASPDRQQVVELGLSSLADTSHALAHVEVRPAAWMGGDLWEDVGVDGRMRFLAQDYHAMLVGYRNTLNGDRQMSAAFARSLLKRRNPGAGAGEHPLDRCEAAFRSAEAYRDLIFAVPGLLEFAPGLDVAGQEDLVSNLPFSAAFDLVDRDLHNRPAVDQRLLRFRFHAGEWFGTPVQGLRHISEAVRACRSGRPRLGHCLAVDCGPNGVTAGPWAALDDGLWLWSTFNARADLLAEVADPLSALAEATFGRGVDLDELAERRAALADLDAWIDLGLVTVTREGRHAFTGVVHPYLADSLGARLVAEHGSDPGVPPSLVDDMIAVAAKALPAAKVAVRTEMAKARAVIEACPTSNLVVGGLHNEDHHPLPEFVSKKLDVTIATDDPGLLGTTIREEYELAFRSLRVAGRSVEDAESAISAMRQLGDVVVARPRIDAAYRQRLDHCVGRLADVLA